LAGHRAGAARNARSRRRRQLATLADIVGFSDNDFRNEVVDDGKIRNIEKALEAALSRRRGRLAVKRAVDIVGAAFALVLLLPLLALSALAIRLTTPGPIIYSQLRRGLNGKPFRIYKFRTFYADHCDASGVRQAIPGDRRVTQIGQLFRRTNIDELPQLWNVLKGDMSLVGPRPHAIGMYAGGVRYEQLVLVYPMRLLVKPGITGLAQLRGFRGPTWNRVQARMRIVCDLQYVAECSNLLDVKILVLTLLQELRGGTGG
jgi:lipopolysaccharide/colanic/teichoic acid biosynthesis glycosyltransferase